MKYRRSCPAVFCIKGVLKNFPNFTGNNLYLSLFFNTVLGFQPETLLKKRLRYSYFSVDFSAAL